MLLKIQETADFIKSKINTSPKTGIILGTGLGNLVTQVTDKIEIPYETIPNFPVSTVEGHSGKLIVGKLGGVDVLAMQGRFHYYEGYDMKAVTFPVRVMKAIGIENLLVSNASGGVHPDFEIGDLMIITDHLNLFPEHPLRGKNFNELGPRFPDMSEAYSKDIVAGSNGFGFGNHIFRVRFAHIRETRAKFVEIFATQRMFREKIEMIGNNHQVTNFKIGMYSTRSIRNE
jgi:purine-nucleoside phosphorylase